MSTAYTANMSCLTMGIKGLWSVSLNALQYLICCMMVRIRLLGNIIWQIIGNHQAGLSIRQIAAQHGIAQSQVSRLTRRWCQTQDVVDRPCSGRPWITTARADRHLVHLEQTVFCLPDGSKTLGYEIVGSWLANALPAGDLLRQGWMPAGPVKSLY